MTEGDVQPLAPSARTEGGVLELPETSKGHLDEGPRFYPEQLLTDRSERFLPAERVRPKIIRYPREELPYATAVRITSILSREAAEGRVLMVCVPGRSPERLLIPELERPSEGQWRYLITRAHPWRRQMSMKGRRLLASTVWSDLLVNHQTPEEAAAEWGIPVEAVDEAVRWCEANRALLDMEAQEEARTLHSAGVAIAPARR